MMNVDWEAVGKFASGAVMMGTWVYLRVMHIQGADDVVGFCQGGLVGLASHYLTNFGSQGQTPASSIVINTPQGEQK